MTGFNRLPLKDLNPGRGLLAIAGALRARKTTTLLLLGSMLLAASTANAVAAGATPPHDEQFHPRLHGNQALVGVLPDAVRLHGAEVDSIKNIESISDWQTLDTKHLTLRINNAQRYLLTLDDQCMHLRGARMVGVSMTNQEIWADFDHIAADGWECRIDTITRLGRQRS